MVNKIPDEYENPLDIIILKQVDRDLEFYKKIGLTPNGLTTISLVLALIGIYNFHHDNYFISALLFFISYYFDCADGKMARKYQMYSKFGDYYDHISDLVKLILLFFIFYKKSFDKFIKIFAITLILFILTFFQIICSEKIYNKKSESVYLNLFKFELDNCEEKIHYFKYFSGATPILFLTLCMFLWDKV